MRLTSKEYERYRQLSVGRYMRKWNRQHPEATAEDRRREAARYYEDRGPVRRGTTP